MFTVILSKFFRLLKRADSSASKSLFYQNSGSSIHKTFRLGPNNYLDISPDATFKIGENVYINESNNFAVKKSAHLSIGKNTYITRTTIACMERIEIGENCILGEGLKIFDQNHKYTTEPFSVSKTDFNTAPVKIGNNVWTGANVTVLKGVTIGDNVIIGANCLIYKDIPADSIVKNQTELIIKSL